MHDRDVRTRYLIPLFGVALLLLSVPAGAVDAPFCAGGEMTLSSRRFTVNLKGPGNDRLVSRKNAFSLPEGIRIDPENDAVTYYVEADRQPVYRSDLAVGSLAATRSRKAFKFKQQMAGGALGKGSSLVLRNGRGPWQMKTRLIGLHLAEWSEVNPQRIKQILKIGDDCFSSLLVCSAKNNRITCEPERRASLKGRVSGPNGTRLSGAMLTAFDDSRLETVSVFVQENGRYAFPPLRAGSYRLRARLIGHEEGWRIPVSLTAGKTRKEDFVLAPAFDTNIQLPATHYFSLLLDKWSSPTSRGDFTLSCGNCHQIGDYRFRRDKSLPQWNSVLDRMVTFLPPFHQETRDELYDAVLDTFGPNAPPFPAFELPPPPSGDILRAVIYEYGLGDEFSRPGCHDLELGLDGVVYADAGVRWINPRTGERGVHPMNGGAHSIERDPAGNMWITQADGDALAYLDVSTGEFRYFPLPVIGEEQGSYPHTLRFDESGRIWFSTTRSNHLTVFDPAAEEFHYYPLPPADAAEVGLTIPTAYGCDVAPDGSIWYSQLHGQRIGRFTPGSDTIRDWRPPFYGPRRLHAGADGIIWVPGYGSGVLGRFDPAIERWKVYDLPTGLPGPDGFGVSETPYALNVNRMNGEVWVTGSNSDTLIRFEPKTEQFTAFPLPTRASYTREIEFDADNNIWTCTANIQPSPDEFGRGKFVKLELPPRVGVCGDGRVDPSEACDDGNTDDCDACSSSCTPVSGCGDGNLCGNELCDDGNLDSCDGCSAACEIEVGLLCGDSIPNSLCGEECDPPVEGFCTDACTVPAFCGNAIPEGDEECDDGNSDDCDRCTSACTAVTGCGDGVVCGGEACDDGNRDACDGCLPHCEIETGHICGDSIVRTDCGEACDPPSLSPACTYLCQTGAADPLGTRHLSFGGSAYSSALGPTISLGTLEGDFDVTGDAPTPDGETTLRVTGPIHYRAAILGGSFGYMCFRISSCTGTIDCTGGTAVGVSVEQDSGGPGVQNNPTLTSVGLGDDAGPGAVTLSCEQAFFQIPGGQGDDCLAQTYPPEQTIVYTSGETEGYFLNADVKVGTGAIAFQGENFSCADWSQEDGPGKLAGTFLLEADPLAGDTANVSVIDD